MSDPNQAAPEVTCDIQRGVAIITLSRAEKLNAYTPDMGEALVALLRECFASSEVNAIVVTGAGKGFCAGADRAYFSGKTARCGKQIGEETFLIGFAAELARAEKPLIAAVNGVATGIGLTMILPFDLRIASTNASFQFPFVRLGVVPAFASSYFLPRLVGHGNARDLLLNNHTLNAEEACAMGLVNRVVAPSVLLTEAISMARAIGEAPKGIVALCKELLDSGPGDSLEDCVAKELRAVRQMAKIKTNQ